MGEAVWFFLSLFLRDNITTKLSWINPIVRKRPEIVERAISGVISPSLDRKGNKKIDTFAVTPFSPAYPPHRWPEVELGANLTDHACS